MGADGMTILPPIKRGKNLTRWWFEFKERLVEMMLLTILLDLVLLWTSGSFETDHQMSNKNSDPNGTFLFFLERVSNLHIRGGLIIKLTYCSLFFFWQSF